MAEHPDAAKEIMQQIYAKLGLSRGEAAPAQATEKKTEATSKSQAKADKAATKVAA